MRDKVFRFAHVMLKNQEDAEDLTQEVIMKLWSKRLTLKEIDNMESYIMRMVKNMSLNRLAASHKRHDSLEEVETKETVVAPHKVLEDRNLLEIMQLIIDGLPENKRMVVQLRSVEGYSLSEVAEITELTENNVRVVLSRARQEIKQIFQQQYDR